MIISSRSPARAWAVADLRRVARDGVVVSAFVAEVVAGRLFIGIGGPDRFEKSVRGSPARGR
jgi:hypothetical protein